GTGPVEGVAGEGDARRAPARAREAGRVAALVGVDRVLQRARHLVVLDGQTPGADAEPQPVLVAGDGVVLDRVADAVEYHDAAAGGVVLHDVVFHDRVGDAAVEHDPVGLGGGAGVVPADVVLDDQVVAPLGADEPVVAVVREGVVGDRQVVRVHVGHHGGGDRATVRAGHGARVDDELPRCAVRAVGSRPAPADLVPAPPGARP